MMTAVRKTAKELEERGVTVQKHPKTKFPHNDVENPFPIVPQTRGEMNDEKAKPQPKSNSKQHKRTEWTENRLAFHVLFTCAVFMA